MATKRYSQTTVLDHEVPEVQGCKHHWLIESPHGPISKGTCRLCGDEKGFRNSLEPPTVEDENADKKSLEPGSNPKLATAPGKN